MRVLKAERLEILWLLVVIPTSAASQNTDIFAPDSIKKTIAAVRIETQLRVDGVLDEPEWQLTKASPRFTQPGSCIAIFNPTTFSSLPAMMDASA